MRFGELTLDDRRFQDLVDEARRQISQRCPEWTEHNVSDPGITLLESFAWMTEQLIYRLNRVPEKLHLALLELLDVALAPPAAAEVDLRFRLASAIDRPVQIPARRTEVTTLAAPGSDPIVFRAIDDFVIPPARPAAIVLQRGGRLTSIPVAGGAAYPSGADEPAFSVPPQLGDAIYIGFEEPLYNLVVRVEVTGDRARGVGVDPNAPPLRWEASDGADWVEAEVLEDTTGGFNESGGAIELQLPKRTSATPFADLYLQWVRCRVSEFTRFGRPSPRYTHPPRLESITARPVGALVRGEQAVTVEDELLGDSDGSPGQTFTVRRVPAMQLREGETLELLEPDSVVWEPWEQVESFAASGDHDRHFRFDAAVGEVELGPAIRTRQHGWRQFGAIPRKGARLRMSRYRHGGGARGSVDAGMLSQLRNPIAGVASVTNPAPASGGVDAESLELGRRRAALELRTRYRAVTTEDFEFLAGEASVAVARACCLPPQPGEAVPLYVLPAVVNPSRQLSLAELTPTEELLERVRAFLDQRRLVGTAVHVMPVPLRGVTVVADVTIVRSAHAGDVERDVKAALEGFVNPLVGGLAGEGWEFGRALNEGELYPLVQDVPGVDRVRMVRMYETDARTPETPHPTPAGARISIARNELFCSATHRVRAGGRDAA